MSRTDVSEGGAASYRAELTCRCSSEVDLDLECVGIIAGSAHTDVGPQRAALTASPSRRTKSSCSVASVGGGCPLVLSASRSSGPALAPSGATAGCPQVVPLVWLDEDRHGFVSCVISGALPLFAWSAHRWSPATRSVATTSTPPRTDPSSTTRALHRRDRCNLRGMHREMPSRSGASRVIHVTCSTPRSVRPTNHDSYQ